MLWKIKPPVSLATIDMLHQQMPTLSIDAISLLINRGINNLDTAKAFFNPSLEQIHDPFLMKGMTEAVEILTEAIAENKKILLYGDYDVDGTCSVSLAYLFLKSINANLDFYIPDRYSEGYGVSDLSVQYAKENNIDLVITMDCGIRAVNQVQKLVDFGIKVIVCDHHEPGNVLPPAHAILDPKQVDCNYPFKELCGCGVAFKLFQGFCQQQSIPEDKLFDFVDILALATCADIVPLVGENRVFVHLGLEKANTSPSLGLKILKKKSGFEGEVNVRTLVFGFAPRINAAGRIEHARGAVELLIAENVARAEELADKVEKNNQERKVLDQSITLDALNKIAENKAFINKKSTVLADESWHKGVIGIVASRCIESYHRPTIIFKETEGTLTGSARSVGNFDILKAISACDQYLDKYGGHKFAAGLSLKSENFEAFAQAFEEEVSKTIASEDLESILSIEQELPLERLNFNFHSLLKRMEPFGPKNMQPIFLTTKLILDKPAILLKDEHLKFSLKTKTGRIDCIGFGMKEDLELVNSKTPFDIAYTLDVNEFRGEKKIQLMLRGIRKSEA